MADYEVVSLQQKAWKANAIEDILVIDSRIDREHKSVRRPARFFGHHEPATTVDWDDHGRVVVTFHDVATIIDIRWVLGPTSVRYKLSPDVTDEKVRAWVALSTRCSQVNRDECALWHLSRDAKSEELSRMAAQAGFWTFLLANVER